MIKNNVKGFTLIELMIVISIMGILMVVAAPRLSGVKGQFKLKTTTQACVLDIRYAQQLSMDTKERHGVFFTPSGYSIEDIDSGKTVKDISFISGVKYTNDSLSSNAVVFGTDGTPYEDNGIIMFNSENKIDFAFGNTSLHAYVNLTPRTGEVSASWD